MSHDASARQYLPARAPEVGESTSIHRNFSTAPVTVMLLRLPSVYHFMTRNVCVSL